MMEPYAIWVLIKIELSRAASMADQPRINRDPNGVNRGRVLSYLTLFCTENRRSMAYVTRIHQYVETWREPGPTQVG